MFFFVCSFSFLVFFIFFYFVIIFVLDMISWLYFHPKLVRTTSGTRLFFCFRLFLSYSAHVHSSNCEYDCDQSDSTNLAASHLIRSKAIFIQTICLPLSLSFSLRLPSLSPKPKRRLHNTPTQSGTNYSGDNCSPSLSESTESSSLDTLLFSAFVYSFVWSTTFACTFAQRFACPPYSESCLIRCPP